MENNDVLRRIRFATDLADYRVMKMIEKGGETVSEDALAAYLIREGNPGYKPCPDSVLSAFLNGLILVKRGETGKAMPVETDVSNNLILKKCRVAFSLRDSDVKSLLQLAGFSMTKSELNALFQKPEHKNYKICGDQVLKKFFQGLTRKLRPDDVESTNDQHGRNESSRKGDQ